jgi:thioesterase domain-containing protein
MKKILFAVMACVAIGFTSCGNKTQQGEAVDSVAIIDSLAQGAAQETIDALSADIEAGDASKLQATLESIKVKIAEIIKNNPEVAKEYVVKVQNFLKENAEKVKSLVGDNAAVAAALSAVTDIEPESVVSGLLDNISEAATDAKDAAVDAVNEKVDEAKQAAEDKANEVKEAAKEKAGEAVDNAAKDIKKGLGI